MTDGVWTGPIFLADEGGFDIVMRALNHYNRRLRHISDSPEVSGAGAMFGSILQSEAMKVAPRLKPIAERLRAGLLDISALAALEDDLDVLEKAMTCYGSDAQKASENAHEYYAKLVEGNAHYRDDVKILEGCIARLKRYG